MPMGAWPSFDACLEDPELAKRYPDEEKRRKVCGAIKARTETKPRVEDASWAATTLPAGDDGHVHEFTVHTYRDSEGQKHAYLYTGDDHLPGEQPLEYGQRRPLDGPGHRHSWNSAKRTSTDSGHWHDLPSLPDDIILELRESVNGRFEEETTMGAIVEEGERFWLVRNVIATRIGVNSQGLYKDAGAVASNARALEGAPLVYGAHPKDASGDYQVDIDPHEAPGFAVNGRVEGEAAVYDALLLKKNPPGHHATPASLTLNERFVEAVRRGEAVHNSLGAHSYERLEEGRARRMGGGPETPYSFRQVRAEVGHIAILSPVAGGAGSCPIPACGALPRGEEDAEHEHAKDADTVAKAFGVSKGAALRAIRDAAKPKG